MQELNDDLNEKNKYIQELENKLNEKTKEMITLNQNFLRYLVFVKLESKILISFLITQTKKEPRRNSII